MTRRCEYCNKRIWEDADVYDSMVLFFWCSKACALNDPEYEKRDKTRTAHIEAQIRREDREQREREQRLEELYQARLKTAEDRYRSFSGISDLHLEIEERIRARRPGWLRTGAISFTLGLLLAIWLLNDPYEEDLGNGVFGLIAFILLIFGVKMALNPKISVYSLLERQAAMNILGVDPDTLY